MPTLKQIQQQAKDDIALKRTMLGKRSSGKLRRPPKWLFPLNVENQYKKILLQIVGVIEQEIKSVLIPALPNLEKQANILKPGAGVRADGYIEDLLGLFNVITLSINNNTPKPEIIAQTIGSSVSVFNKQQFQKTIRSVLGVNVFNTEPWLSDQLSNFSSQNVDLIKDLQGKALNDIKGVVQRGLAAGQTQKQLTEAINGRVDVTKSRAKLIARDQTNKLNGQLTQLRQTSVGIEQYQWATAGDERVRPSHAEKDGNVYRWDDPPGDTGHPGNDINCRCSAIPILEPLAT